MFFVFSALSFAFLIQLTFDEANQSVYRLLSDGEVGKIIPFFDRNPKLVNAVFEGDNTPLHLAVRSGNAALVEYLLQRDVDVNAVAFLGQTPIHVATDEAIIKLLLAKKPKLDVYGSRYESPLESAAYNFRIFEKDNGRYKRERAMWDRKIRLLLDAGAYYDIRSAIYLNDTERVKAILKAEPARANDTRPELPAERKGAIDVPLRKAAGLNRYEICKVLLAAKADPNDFENYAGRPIICSCMQYPEVVKLLIEAGADLKKPINSRWNGRIVVFSQATPLHYAIADGGTSETVQLLIKHGVSLDRQDSAGRTALHLAVGLGKWELTKYLVDRGARIDLKDEEGRMPVDIINQLTYYNGKPASEEETKKMRQLLESKVK